MAKSELIVGLDIGTTKICTVVGEVGTDSLVDIIGIGTSPSTGLRKGGRRAPQGQGARHDKVTPNHMLHCREPFMSETSAAAAPAASNERMPPESIIAVEHVSKSVTDSTGTLEILRDIDFRLAPRETAAIVGASGSGKSTLLSIIAGLDTPTRGTVRLGGQDLFALDEDDRAALRARQVGFVFQPISLKPWHLEQMQLPFQTQRCKPSVA